MMKRPSLPLKLRTDPDNTIGGADSQVNSQRVTAPQLSAANIAAPIPHPTARLAQGQTADANTNARVRISGQVVDCDGVRATVLSTVNNDTEIKAEYWAVGQLISIAVASNRIVGVVTSLSTRDGGWESVEVNTIKVTVELVGEIVQGPDLSSYFSSGITVYPHLGSIAHRIRKADLQTIYRAGSDAKIEIGTLSQDPDLLAYVSAPDLISRHFAVLGTTGTGKSTAVSLILREVSRLDPNLSIVILDPHNEFVSAFGNQAELITPEVLDLPFWVFNFEEFSHVVFRGRDPDPIESDLLRQFVPMARAMFKDPTGNSTKVRKQRSYETGGTDTPSPFRISDIQWLINERVGGLDQSPYRLGLRALNDRLSDLVHDPRYTFMFRQNPIEDNLHSVISKIYRLPKNGKPITSFQLSGLPSETVNAVVSVVCRLAFDLAVNSSGLVRSLIICEEAHRYIPFDRKTVFEPTREAIARIAKEGRKYGCGLGIISQRPRDLDTTILSQCNTFFCMRLGSEEDQKVVGSAISTASDSMIRFLSSLGDREAIAFGQAIGSPMRMTFKSVSTEKLPGNHFLDDEHSPAHLTRPKNLSQLIDSMRKI